MVSRWPRTQRGPGAQVPDAVRPAASHVRPDPQLPTLGDPRGQLVRALGGASRGTKASGSLPCAGRCRGWCRCPRLLPPVKWGYGSCSPDRGTCAALLGHAGDEGLPATRGHGGRILAEGQGGLLLLPSARCQPPCQRGAAKCLPEVGTGERNLLEQLPGAPERLSVLGSPPAGRPEMGGKQVEDSPTPSGNGMECIHVRCCGWASFYNWTDNAELMNRTNVTYPCSCEDKREADDSFLVRKGFCEAFNSTRTESGNNPEYWPVYREGCMKKVQAWLQENVGIILGVCVGVAVIELLGMLLSICLCRHVHSEDYSKVPKY
ncbi:CD82 antigen isoform X1 [Canis lupus baileyi]|uniref:CD82 antigen isoform X1 n=1 Tax=Canis lupus baileyi TaxID=143281 RepID=UPI003B97CC71